LAESPTNISSAGRTEKDTFPKRRMKAKVVEIEREDWTSLASFTKAYLEIFRFELIEQNKDTTDIRTLWDR
jgi:hypothetical protein